MAPASRRTPHPWFRNGARVRETPVISLREGLLMGARRGVNAMAAAVVAAGLLIGAAGKLGCREHICDRHYFSIGAPIA